MFMDSSLYHIPRALLLPTKYHATTASPAIVLFVFVVIAVALLVLIVLVGPASNGHIGPGSGVGVRGLHPPPIQFFSGQIKNPNVDGETSTTVLSVSFGLVPTQENIYHFVELSFYTPE